MENKIQIPQEDLDKINHLVKNKQLLIEELGSIKAAEIELEERENNAIEFRNQLLNIERELSEKYGNGIVNTDDGTFTPNS